jgi:hypothetical protein
MLLSSSTRSVGGTKSRNWYFSRLGTGSNAGFFMDGYLFSFGVHQLIMTESQIRLMATRRGIADERAERRVYSIPAAPTGGGARRRRLLCRTF